MIGYYLLFPFIYLIAYLPTRLLFLLANLIAWALEYVFRYRRRVIDKNLTRSFPTLSISARSQIVHHFYLHLADMIVENVKCLTISKEELTRRIDITDVIALCEKYNKESRPVVMILGHCGAWQWSGLSVAANIAQPLYAVYNPIKQQAFDNLIQRSRSRWGMKLIPMNDYLPYIKTRFQGAPSVHFFLFDQNPSNPSKSYWTTFLNQDTAFQRGPIHFARVQEAVVVFTACVYQGRGRYKVSIHQVADTVDKANEDEVMEQCVKLLDAQIQETPADWLWSHRRWKHKRQ